MAYREDSDLEFLSNCRNSELQELVNILTNATGEELTSTKAYNRNPSEPRMYWKEIAAEIQRFGGHSLVNLLRGGEGVLYREILCDVCEALDIKYKKSLPTTEIETLMLESLFEKISSAEKEKAIRWGEEAKLLIDEYGDTTKNSILRFLPYVVLSAMTITGGVVGAAGAPAYRVTTPVVIYVACLRKKYLSEP